jgi:hypothetical protein
MADGMQLDADELQVLNASLHFAFIRIVVPMWGHAGYAEESAWMTCAQIGNAVVRFRSDGCPWVRLHDGRVYATLVHTAQDIFLGSEQPENATFAQVSMGIDLLGHESSLG